MRFYQSVTGQRPKLQRTVEADRRMGSWLKMKIEDGIAKRWWLDESWRASLRKYESIPTLRKTEASGDQGQPAIQVPLGASMTDSIASAIYDLIFNASPVLSVRGSPEYDQHAYAVQLLVNKFLEDDFINLSAAANETIIDTVMLGTGGYYIVNTKETLKRAHYQELKMGPRVSSIPPEDIVVPGGSYRDVNDLQLIAYRNYFYEAELVDAAQLNNWDISNFMVAGNVEWVRQRRIEAAKTDVDLQIIGGIYEVFYAYCQYDYDSDGYAEDLFVVWDRTSYECGYADYAPYDCKPFEISIYQLRPHIFYGMGVMEMDDPFETEVTEWHNFKMENAHLANARFWGYKLGAAGMGEEFKISPRKAVGFADPSKDIVGIQMADMYPSAQQYEAATIALAEMRVGTPAANQPNRQGVSAGKRVPAATAQAVLQQQNRRFTGPFDNVRKAFARAATQCLARMRESYNRGGDGRKRTMEYIVRMVGVKYATLIEEVFKLSETVDMRDKMLVETTANAASINRQMDRQNAIERIQVLGAYYDKSIAVQQVIFNQQTPDPIRRMMIGVLCAMNVSIRAFLRTFDDIRDADTFIPDTAQMLEDMTKGAQGANQQQGQPGQQPTQGAPAGGDSQGVAGLAPTPSGPSDQPPEPEAPSIGGSAELGRGAQDTGTA